MPPEHIIHLFDTTASMAAGVSAFLADGWRAGDRLLAIAKPRHWTAIAGALAQRGVPLADAEASGRLIVLDAAEVLSEILVQHAPAKARFADRVGTLVAQATADGARLRAYGELVELLAEEGYLEGARAIEEYWNALLARHPVALLCGYTAAHFADERSAAGLRAIRDCHTRVQRGPDDLLGSWLLPDDQGHPLATR